MTGAMFKMKDDSRVTKVRKFICKTSIDDFPQLWNVLKGDMSLVGPPAVAVVRVVAIKNYWISKRTIVTTGEEQTIDLPRSNVLKYHLANGSWFCLRPSGTEPKAKFYFGVKGMSLVDSESRLERLENAVMTKVNAIILNVSKR
jgi:phosphomannomutase